VCLSDLEVVLEVLQLEVVELGLVVQSLILIGLNDSFHHSLAILQVFDRLDVVVGEFKVSSILEDPFETGNSEGSALDLGLELLESGLEGVEFEINLGGVTEVDGPLEEAAEDGDVGLALNCGATLKAVSQTVQIGFSSQNELKVA